jgi:hypothetical protein
VLSVFLFLFVHNLQSQNYPVQITTQLIPPFSGYLPDYSNPGNQNLKLLVTFTDFSKPSYNIKLKLKISGQGINIQSKSFYYEGPFSLQPGVPFEISGSDLAGLLNSNNLDFSGLNKNQYEQGKILPEGYYQVCFTAYDFNNPTQIQVSNESCAFAWIVLSDPPFLNLPACGSTENIFNPQNVIFQWTPMNLNSPNSGLNTTYEFSLFEVWPAGQSPNNIVQTLPPIYQTTTALTMLNYGITEPVLNLGMEYAWRVKAIDGSGRDVFKNQGYSQTCTFTYGSITQFVDSSALKLKLNAIPVTHRLGKFSWDSLNVFKSYKLQYRKKGTSAWFDDGYLTKTYNFVPNLESGVVYEGQVRGIAQDGTEGPWSNLAAFTTPNKPSFVCGQANGLPPQDFKPLVKAAANMIWEVGQFEMVVTSLMNPQSPTGRYSGYGKIEIPFLLGAQMYCKYNNILVNEQMQVVLGEVNVLTEGLEAWMSHYQYPPGWNEADSININGNVNTVSTNGGQILVNGNPAGNTGHNTVITGNNGTTYVSSNGTVTQENYPKGAPVGMIASLKDSLATVEFKAHSSAVYSFDSKSSSSQTGGEEKDYEFLPQGKTKYYIPYKLLVTGTEEKVTATVSGAAKIKEGSLVFKRSDGTLLPSTAAGNDSYEIGIKGRLHLYTDAVWAFAKSKSAGDTNLYPIGKINMVSIDKKTKTAIIVPVNGNGQSIDVTNLQNDLNMIYKKLGVEWTLGKGNNLTVNDYHQDSLLKVSRSALNTTYGSDLKKIITAYKSANPATNSNTSYLFLCNKATGNELGYMALNKMFGFIFLHNNTKVALTAAHELGHGAFVLEHSFNGGNSGSTQNLMDYNNGELFNHKQWVSVHDPKAIQNLINSLIQDEESGTFLQTANSEEVFAWLEKIKVAVRNNQTFKINKNTGLEAVIQKTSLNGISYDYIKVRIDKVGIDQTVTPKNKITNGVISYFVPNQNTHFDTQCLDIDGGKIKVEVPQNRLTNMKVYLEGILGSRNVLLFVNGYRDNAPNMVEFAQSANEIYTGDIFNYWEGIDAEFINRIGTKNVVYADGHHSVSTSNHLTQNAFLGSYASSLNAKKASEEQNYPIPTVTLHTAPNVSGFTIRKNHGNLAGDKLLVKLNNGEIPCQKNSSGKIIDTLDIVCHSMGFAYAQGIIEKLRGKIIFGRYYILAAENPCSGIVKIDGEWQEIWQYGSNEAQEPNFYQDGVAPQCRINGLEKLPSAKTIGGRVYIPLVEPRGFLVSHSISNYKWIFNSIGSGEKGYVKKRN